MRIRLILILSIYWASLCSADEYLLIDAKINDQPVRLTFDTGAEYTALFERAAQRLNLNVSYPPGNPKRKAGRIPLRMTEPCRFTLGDITQTWRLAVLKLPDHIRPEFDGILAWSSVRKGILRIDAAAKHVGPRMDLPGDIDRWSKWQVDPQGRLLAVKVPHATDPNAILFIDTGNPFGVELNAARWKNWCANHPDRPKTLCANYSPSVGLKVYEECWAEKLTIGRFTIAQVPVTPADAVFAQWFTGKNYQGALGLFALTRFEVIIDGRNDVLYTRPVARPTTNYDYNRIGAVFVPRAAQSNDLTARVLPESPAYAAGIRDGDVLCKIDDLDATQWRTDPNVLPLSRFWERSVGTKLNLTLSRDDKTYHAAVELENIFPQNN